jgi:hypothetical protein
MFIKAVMTTYTGSANVLNSFFNLFRSENECLSAALVAGIVNTSSNNLKFAGKCIITEEHTLLTVYSIKQHSQKMHHNFLLNTKMLFLEMRFYTYLASRRLKKRGLAFSENLTKTF